MTRRLAALCLAVLTLLGGGCWDLREVDQRATALSLAIDPAESGEGFRITLHFPIPRSFQIGAGGGGERANVQVESSGRTLMEAVHNANQRLARTVYFGHLEAIVLGAGVARSGVVDVLGALARHPEVQPNTLVAVAEPTAASIFQAPIPQERLAGTYLVTLFERGNRARRTPPMPLWRVESLLAREQKDLVLPMLGVEGEQIRVGGLAVIQDGKMAGTLDVDEMQGYMWARGDVIREVLVLEGERAENLSVRTFGSRSRVRPRLAGGRLVMQVQIIGEAQVSEELPERTLTPERIDWLERQAAGRVRDLVGRTVERAQAMKADIFGWGRVVQARLPRYWQRADWDRVFPNLQVELDVRIQVRRTGNTL